MAIIVPEERGRMYGEEFAKNWDPAKYPTYPEHKVGDKLQTKYGVKCEIIEIVEFDKMFNDNKYKVKNEKGDFQIFYGFDLYPLDMCENFYWQH